MAPTSVALCIALLLSSGTAVHGFRLDQASRALKDREDLATFEGAFEGAELIKGTWPPPSLSELQPSGPLPPNVRKQMLNVGAAPACVGPTDTDVKEAPPFKPSPGAAREAVGMPRGANLCSGLGDAIDKQFDAMLKHRAGRTWVWTVSNSVYGDMLADWWVQMRRIGLPHALIVAVDKDPAWARELCAMGFDVIDANEQGKSHASVAFAKIGGAMHFARLGTPNMFSEMDIFWRRGTGNVFKGIWDAAAGTDLTLARQGWNEMNIGLWIARGSASPLLADFMHLTLQNIEHGHMWDQTAFNEVAHACCTMVGLNGPVKKSNEQLSIACPKSLRSLKVGTFSENTVITNGYYGTAPRADAAPAEQKTDAFHIWTHAGPLHSGRGKLMVAQEAGLWEGANCYYEQCKSDARYIAWDGILSGGRAASAMRLLLDLGWSSKRTVIIPRKDNTFGEASFGVGKFEGHIAFRGSNFLFQPLMKDRALYPVSQVAVHMTEGVASIRHIEQNNRSYTEYFEFPRGVALELAAAAVLKSPKVAASKTVVVSVLYGANSRIVEGKGSCGASGGFLRLCNGVAKTWMTATDVCM